MKKMIVTIKKIDFPTDGTGIVKAVVRLAKTYKYKSVDFDAIVLDSIKVVFDNRLQKNSKLDITINSEGKIDILNYISPTTVKAFKLPVICNSCNSKLKAYKETIICDNVFCKASDRSSIYIMLSKLTTDYKLVNHYLNNFPTPSNTEHIHNLLEYLHFFKQSGPKNTETREKMIYKINKLNDLEKYNIIQIERKLEIILNTLHDNSFYWEIFNVPNFKLSELKNLNPATMTFKQIDLFKTSKKIQTLENGKQYFKRIMNEFKNNRSK